MKSDKWFQLDLTLERGIKMRKILFVFLIGLVLLTRMTFALVDGNATYVSKYIWRGFDLNAAQPAVQPGFAVGLGDSGASLGLWGSYNIGSTAKQELTELDATLDFSSSVSGVDYSVGYTYYTFPNLTGAAAKSGEFYARATLGEVPFGPGLTIYYDHDQGKGLYASLSGGYDFSMISSSLALGYNGGQWGAKSGSTDIALGLASEIPVGALTVAPSVNYVLISDTSVNPNSSEFWFGIDVTGSI